MKICAPNYEAKAWRNDSAVQLLNCKAEIACRHVATVDVLSYTACRAVKVATMTSSI